MMKIYSTKNCVWGVVVGLLMCCGTVRADEIQLPQYIQRVDIVPTTHTDIGYTDHPAVTREQQVRYVDIALDAVLQTMNLPETEKYYWEAEGPLAISDWWQTASPERKNDLIRAVQSGQFEIGVLGMNQTPTLNTDQWKVMLHWLPEELEKIVPQKVGIQNDVNGFPRAGALALLDNGVKNLWMGINATNGHAPFQVPAPYWWKMPDGRRLFVWFGESYPMGFFFFHDFDWRRGPVPEATDTNYRPPRPEEVFKTDENSLRHAHAVLCGKLRAYEAAGYRYSTMPLSITNVWRMDNDPPFPHLSKFVGAWNKLGLKPAIYLSTASNAMERLKKEAQNAPEYSGEFTDWWANGVMSGPHEVAASRIAKRNLTAALSPIWGDVNDPKTQKAADKILRELCIFDEHTWGSVDSVGLPHHIDTLAQFNEKARTAYYGLALSKMILAQRARTKIYPMQNGYYLANTAPKNWNGWIYLRTTALREDISYLCDPISGWQIQVEKIPEDYSRLTVVQPEENTVNNSSMVRFWVDNLKGLSILRLVPTNQPPKEKEKTDSETFQITSDDNGWPVRLQWKDEKEPMFTESPGDFVSVEFKESGGRWKYNSLLHAKNLEQRNAALREIAAESAEKTTVQENEHSIVFSQMLRHPRLKWSNRRLEVFRQEHRAILTVQFYRLSSEQPECFFIGCSFPNKKILPTTSCGGVPFTPFTDQLPNTCRDYFSIDSWVHYSGQANSSWTWISRDAPLVSIGGIHVLKHLDNAPEQPNKLYAMVFDNTWMTNFVADEHGIFEFQFDLVQGLPNDSQTVAEHAETLLSTPQLVIHPDLPEDPIFMKRLFQP